MKKKMIEIVIFSFVLVAILGGMAYAIILQAPNTQSRQDIYVNLSGASFSGGNVTYYSMFKNQSIIPIAAIMPPINNGTIYSVYSNVSYYDRFQGGLNASLWTNVTTDNSICTVTNNFNVTNMTCIGAATNSVNLSTTRSFYINESNVTFSVNFEYRYTIPRTTTGGQPYAYALWRLINSTIVWFEYTIDSQKNPNCGAAGAVNPINVSQNISIQFKPFLNRTDIYINGVITNSLGNNITGQNITLFFQIAQCDHANNSLQIFYVNKSEEGFFGSAINTTITKSNMCPWCETVNVTPYQSMAPNQLPANTTWALVISTLPDKNLSLVPIAVYNRTGDGLICAHPDLASLLGTFSCVYEANMTRDNFNTNSYNSNQSSAFFLIPDDLSGTNSYVFVWGKKSNSSELFNFTVSTGDRVINMSIFGNFSYLDEFETNLSDWTLASDTGGAPCGSNFQTASSGKLFHSSLCSGTCNPAGNAYNRAQANITSRYITNETTILLQNLSLTQSIGSCDRYAAISKVMLGNQTIIGNCTASGVGGICHDTGTIPADNNQTTPFNNAGGTFRIDILNRSSGLVQVSNGTFSSNFSVNLAAARLAFITKAVIFDGGTGTVVNSSISLDKIQFGYSRNPKIMIDSTTIFSYSGDFNQTYTNTSSISAGVGAHTLNITNNNQPQITGTRFYPTGDVYIWFPSATAAPSTTTLYYANITPITVFRNTQMNCTWRANSTQSNETLSANITWVNGSVAYTLNNFTFTNFTQNALQTTILNNGSLASNITRKSESWKCNVTVWNTFTNSQVNQLSDAVTISNSIPTILTQTSITNFTTLNKFNVTATAVDADDTTDLINCTHYHRTAGSNIWSTRLGIFSNVSGICIGEVNTTTSNGSLNYRPNQNIESLLSFYDGSGENINSSAINNTIPLLAPYIGSNATNPTTVTFGTAFNLSVNVTGNATITTRFAAIGPAGNAMYDYNTTITNSTDTYVSRNQPFNESGIWQFNITAYNGFGSDLSSFNISSAQYAARINNFTTIPPVPTLFNNITGYVNVTSDLNLYLVTAVNFTLMAPNGSLVINNKNGTRYGTTDARWNSTFFVIRPAGTWMLNATAFTNESNSTTSSLNFTVTDNVIFQPASFTATMDPRGKNFTPVFTMSHDSTQSLAFTFAATMLNDQYFLNQTNITSATFNNGVLLSVLVNITNINSSLPDAIYDGNFTITRTIDGRVIRIPLRVTVNPPAADIDLLNASTLAKCSGANCDWTDVSSGGIQASSYRWVLNNSGNFSAAECNPTLTGSASNLSYLFSISDFSLAIGQQRNITLSIFSHPAGTWMGSVDVTCNATTLGFKDSVSADPTNTPKINFTYPPVAGGEGGGGGGGGGGGVPRPPAVETPPEKPLTGIQLIQQECGNNVCDANIGEDAIVCPQDCSIQQIKFKQIVCIPSQPECIWARAWAVPLMVVLGLIALISLVIANVVRKKKSKRR